MKRMTIAAAIALVGALGLAGCQGEGTKTAGAESADMKAYQAAKAEAVAERKKAKKMGGEWRDIGKFLKKADKAAKKGDFKTANKLIATIKFQSMMGQKQAAEQANAGNPDYLK